MSKRQLRVYRALTVFYPKSFRADYGEDLVLLFQHQIEDETPSRVWLRVLRDLAVTVPTLHLEARMNRPNPYTLSIVSGLISSAAMLTLMVTGTTKFTAFAALIALGSALISYWAWKDTKDVTAEHRLTTQWWKFVGVGLALIAGVIVLANVPHDGAELGGNEWFIGAIAATTGVISIVVGSMLGIGALVMRSGKNAES